MEHKESRNRVFVGLVLIALGLVSLVPQIFDFSADMGWLILPALAITFLGWGIFTRQAGPIIPGGIIGGISLGIYLVEYSGLTTDDGALFMFAFAGGWALITLLTAVFTRETHWWALIPAAIMALIGSVVVGVPYTETLLTLFGQLWPVALILAGLFVIFRRGLATK